MTAEVSFFDMRSWPDIVLGDFLSESLGDDDACGRRLPC
jgi:hypothetical protein